MGIEIYVSYEGLGEGRQRPDPHLCFLLQSCSGSPSLIQHSINACNFWEFLGTGLLPVDSNSYTTRLCSCCSLVLLPASITPCTREGGAGLRSRASEAKGEN